MEQERKFKKGKRRSSGKSVKKAQKPEKQQEEEMTGPATMVIRRGDDASKTIKTLVADTRLLLSPGCAVNLKERKANTIKDFTAVAGQLGITHMLVFKTSEIGNTHLKIPRLPHGPTLTFRINEYTLSSDIHKLYGAHTPGGKGYLTPPLLVLNGFLGVEEKHVKLIKLTFNDMFPQFNINKIKLHEIRRIVLLDYNKETDSLELRHYLAQLPDVEVASDVVNKIVTGKITDFSQYKDISEFFLGNQAQQKEKQEQDKKDEEEDDENVIEMESKISRKSDKTKLSKKKVTLVELGPRLTMQLVKIEEKVMDVQKTPEEVEALRIKKKKAEAAKQARRDEQEKNVLNKKGGKGGKDEYDVYSDGEGSNSEDSKADDLEWYRKEVGQEPDAETAEILNASTKNAQKSSQQRKDQLKTNAALNKNKRKENPRNDKKEKKPMSNKKHKSKG